MAQLPSIPTGGSSLYLGDFAKPLYGITQNLTSAMIDQYERRKQEGDQDRAAMLKALSFEAIEGASEKASKMLLDEYSAMEDKWTKRYQERGLKLSDQDYFELQRDKRMLDTKAARVRGNVANAMAVQNEIVKNGDQYNKRTMRNWTDFVTQGKIGLEDPLNLLVPKADVTGIIKKKYHSVLADPDNFEIRRGEYDPETGQVKTWRSNEGFIENAKKKIMADPDIMNAVNDPDEGPENLEALNQILDLYKISETPRTDAAKPEERKSWEAKNMTPEQRALAKKTGKRYVDPAVASRYATFNDFASKVLSGDEGTLNQAGKGASISMTKNAITITYESGGKTKAEVIPMPDLNNPEEVKIAKLRILQYAPRNIKGDTQIEPEYITGDVEVKGDITPAPSAEYKEVKKALGGEYGSTVFANKGTKEEKKYTAGSADHLKYVTGKMKEYLPEDTIDYNTPIIGKNKITWNFDGEDHTYIMKDKSDRERLLNDIDTKIGRLQAPVKTAAPAQSAVEDRQQAVDDAKQNVINVAKNYNLKSVQEYKDFLLSVGKSEADVDSAIQMLSLTDDDFR